MSLYKYLVPERFDVLQNGRIRFSQHMALNDPFEMKPFFDGVASDVFLTQFFNASWQAYGDDALELIDGLIPEALKDEHYRSVIAQSKSEIPAADLLLDTHRAKMPELRNVIFTSFNDGVGALCLTEERDNLVMWAHYANNYKGFVIEFDDNHEFFHEKDSQMGELGHVRQVNYSQDRPNHVSFTDLSAAEIFFLKCEEWSYEKEWRMLKRLPSDEADEIKRDADGQPIYLFSFPPESVIAIVLGSRMPHEVQNKFSEFLSTDRRYSSVKLYRAILDEKKFQLRIEPIEAGQS